jgi:hypothetical protein
MTVASLDSSWYRSVNEFARDTGWAHGVLANYANWGGLVLRDAPSKNSTTSPPPQPQRSAAGATPKNSHLLKTSN